MAEDVVRETEVPVGPERVWRWLTDPALLAQWLGEDGKVELRPGGGLTIRTLEGEERSGWVEAADPHRRLAFWWRDDDGGDPTRVQFELEETAGGTRVRVTESRPMARLELQATQLAEGMGGASGGPQMLVRT